MDIELTCLYCDHKWIFIPSYYAKVSEAKCPICNDSNIKAKEISKETKDVYGYDVKEK